jgi:hypothetical protein
MDEWVNELENLLSSGPDTDLLESFALKIKYIPIKLYKYRSLDC